jgi:glycosyltransferase involved in cell wall biosynthesis
MRLLIASPHRNLVGGVEKYLQALVPGLIDRGIEVGLLHEHVIAPGRERIDPPQGFDRVWCLEELDAKSALASVAAWRPDFVYCQGWDAAESVTVEKALLEAYPAALYVHNYDRTCASGRKCHALPKVEACTRQLGPACLALYLPRRCGGLNPLTMLRQYRHHVELNARLPDYQSVLVASRYMHRELARHGVDEQRLRLAPLPTTDVLPHHSPPAPRSPSGKILFAGRLTDIKGAAYLVRAIPRAQAKLERPLTLTIAGDGPERGALEREAGRLGVSVQFHGWIGTSEKIELMRQADLLAVPSLWPEPFALVGIEAGCLGIPAAGYAVGGIPDWLIAGETGELAPADPPTVEGLADAIVRALADHRHYQRLSHGAWTLARKFTLENHLAQLEPILGLESHLPNAAPAPARARI